MVAQWVYQFSAPYGTQSYTTMFTRAQLRSPLWVTWIHFTTSYPISLGSTLISILILSCHLHVGLTSTHLPWFPIHCSTPQLKWRIIHTLPLHWVTCRAAYSLSLLHPKHTEMSKYFHHMLRLSPKHWTYTLRISEWCSPTRKNRGTVRHAVPGWNKWAWIMTLSRPCC